MQSTLLLQQEPFVTSSLIKDVAGGIMALLNLPELARMKPNLCCWMVMSGRRASAAVLVRGSGMLGAATAP